MVDFLVQFGINGPDGNPPVEMPEVEVKERKGAEVAGVIHDIDLIQ